MTLQGLIGTWVQSEGSEGGGVIVRVKWRKIQSRGTRRRDDRRILVVGGYGKSPGVCLSDPG